MLFFVQTLTLNVAVNRSDLALVTLLISNNMTEIKSQVMKVFSLFSPLSFFLSLILSFLFLFLSFSLCLDTGIFVDLFFVII